MNKYIFIIGIAAIGACVALCGINHKLRKESNRLRENQSALISKMQHYQDAAGRYATSVEQLQLTNSELTAYNEKLVRVIDDLNIKLKRVKATSTTATKTKVEIKTIVKDSIIYVDSSRYRTMPTIEWRDAWLSVEGVIHPDSSVSLSVQNSDTLYQVIHRVPRKFLFFRFGTKAIRQEIVNTNPHSKIEYSEYIELRH